MTYRKVVSYGLIAGLRYEEIRDKLPGEVLDLFIYRRHRGHKHLSVFCRSPRLFLLF